MIKFLIDSVNDLFSAILGDIGKAFEKDHGVNAEFGNPNKLLSKSNKGWCVDGTRFLDMDTSRRNMCVIAGSGKGKTQVHIFPTLLNAESSMVVNDNSGELSATVPYLNSIGIKTFIMNLTEKGGVYINPLDFCQGDISAMRKIAKTLMGFSSDKNDFFSLSGEDCVALFIQFLLESEPHHANLGNVYKLILEYQGSPQVTERLIADKASDAVWEKFKALAGNSERTLKSITATALSALSWLGDNPTLSDLTSMTSIRFEDFRQSPHVLFIQSPVSDAKFYAPMISLVLQTFYRYAFAQLPSERDLDIMIVLDEFGSLIPGLPDYSQIISNSRKFKIPQLLILQDESLLSPYKELKENILQNCFVKAYYGGLDKKAHELEKLLGNYSYTDKETGQKRERPLMYASEIREMDNEILVLPNGQKPLKVTITPAYKQSRLRKRLAMFAESPLKEPLEYSIQYLDLSPYRDDAENTTDNANDNQV